MRDLAGRTWVQGVRSIFASGEQKARDAAQLLADGLGLDRYGIIDSLGENDRSATGYLPKPEFEATADAFFAEPQTNVRGWEPAAQAQTRIIKLLSWLFYKPPKKEKSPLSAMEGREHCSIAISPKCRSVESMSSLRQTAETGSRLIGRPGKLLHPGWRSIDALTVES